MTSSRKNNAILINDEALGALELIENQIFSKFNRLMNEKEANEIYETGFLAGEPMPYTFVFAPYGKKNQETIRNAAKGERIELLNGGKTVGHIEVGEVFKFNSEKKSQNIFRANEAASAQQSQSGELALSGKIKIYNDKLSEVKKLINAVKREQNVRKISAIMLTAEPLTARTNA